MERVPFMKMNGNGNDFIVVDNRNGIMKNYNLPKFIKKVCVRRVSIGADGFMMLEESEKADFRMRYFNGDGSEGEMCGNGARCISRFAHLLGIVDNKMSFETNAGIYESELIENNVRLKFPSLRTSDLKLCQTGKFGGQTLDFHFAQVGVPHVIIYRADINEMSDKNFSPLVEVSAIPVYFPPALM